MAGICDSVIAQGIGLDCSSPIVKGVENTGIIINRNDIDFANTIFDASNGNIITQLVLKDGKHGYQVVQSGATPFTGVKTDLATGTYRNTFTNECPIVVLDNGPEVAKNIIDGLANGSYVLIIRNVHKGTDGKSEFQVYGYYQGLRASAIANEKYSDDTEGGWLVTLQETGVPKSALFYFVTDSAKTETAFNALLSE